MLIRKLNFLSSILIKEASVHISSRVLTSGLITNLLEVSIIQQCHLLKHHLGLTIGNNMLKQPEIADYIAKALTFKRDKTQLLTKAKHYPKTSLIWRISTRVSWQKIYDEALNHRSKGTTTIQRIIKTLTHPNRLTTAVFVEIYSIRLSSIIFTPVIQS